MDNWSRRGLLKGAAAVPAAGASLPALAQAPDHTLRPIDTSGPRTRTRSLLDFDWRFHFGHASDPAKDFGFGSHQRENSFQKAGNFIPASQLSYDDSDWTNVDLPHDWAIGLPLNSNPVLTAKGGYPLGRDYPETSVGWYRKIFDLPAEDADRRISVEFDGAYRETMVAVNGFYVGQHSGGYDSFSFDLTDFVTFGGPNVLLVRVDATLADGWFYEGAGIYRHAWLVKTSPVHVKKWGTAVRSKVEPGQATLSILTEVDNASGALQSPRVVSTVLDPSGQVVAQTTSDAMSIGADGGRAFAQSLVVSRPQLWSLEQRNLYVLVTEVEVEGRVVDHYRTRFGIRSLRFDAQQGFFLNDQHVKIKGTCNHQDHAGLGAALPDAAQRYRVRKLQEMGSNGYRTSHNPPTPALLDVCDELGMLVLAETRMASSNPEGLSQFEDMVRRDRNHPCVFMWSMANEEMPAGTENGLRIFSALKRVAYLHDGTRPVTIAAHPIGEAKDKGGLSVSDVMGFNYGDPLIPPFHATRPRLPIIQTESVSGRGTRGEYVTDPARGVVSSYDLINDTGSGSAEGWWRFSESKPWLMGGFVWTGFDYRGETTPYRWPNVSSNYGIMDTCGNPKETYYYYKSWWQDEPVLHLFPHWNWPQFLGQDVAVWVYSNLDKVELLHNGRSLGVKDVPRNGHVEWLVAYAPGAIEARGFRGGRRVRSARRETTGAPARIVLRPDRVQIAADGQDLCFVTIEIQDAEGRTHPLADNLVTLRVSGAGVLAGTGNGDPRSHESDLGPTRKAYNGLGLAILRAARAPGVLTLHAESPGLAPPSPLTITVTPAPERPVTPSWVRPVPKGPGVSGLWRPQGPVDVSTRPDVPTLANRGETFLFTLVEEPDRRITGRVEGAPTDIFGASGNGSIEDGRVEGGDISFRAGNATYAGKILGDRIDLKQITDFRRDSPAGGRKAPAVGPPPTATSGGTELRTIRAETPLVLARSSR